MISGRVVFTLLPRLLGIPFAKVSDLDSSD